MTIKLHCRNDDKCPSDNKPFTMEINDEAVMDVNNMASVFCPHCNRTLKSAALAGDKKPQSCRR